MLSKENNDLLTQTGPGTPGGKLLRSYWQPIVTADEMPIDGHPLPLKVMGENLVLFRDDQNRLGLIGLHCAHRGTDLSYGRVENGGLRCLYHGWLFDINGKCIDQSAEPEDKKFCHKVRQTSYPVQERGGVIWAYMGEGEAPLIPDYQFLNGPEENRLVFRVVFAANWLQSLESNTDPAHTTYLHKMPSINTSVMSGNNVRALRGDEPPKIDIEHTSYGTRIYALHNSPQGRRYLRVNNYVFPNLAVPNTATGESGYSGRWYVPINDESCSSFEFYYRHSEPLKKDVMAKFRNENVGPDRRHVRRPENRYQQDRETMKEKDGAFSGMGRYFPAHDAFAVETQGAIQDRTNEHLGSTDIVIIEVRKALLAAIKQMELTGEPPGRLRVKEDSGRPFRDFICTEVFLNDGEDGPSYCRRFLSEQAKAAE